MKIKILFVIPSLRTGGAERVMAFLATNISKQKFLPHLLVVGSDEQVSYDVNGVDCTFLNKSKVRHGLLGITKYIKKNKPDIVFGAIAHLNTSLALISIFFPKTKFVGRETSVTLDGTKKKKWSLSHNLTRLQTSNLDAIVCQSNDMQKNLIENMGYRKEKIRVINNPISSRFKLKRKREEDKLNRLITVGRLVKIKGHERILKALRRMALPFHYTIIGDGPEKENIRALSEEYGLKSNVTYIAFSQKVEDHLAKNDVFLQGSYSEGFPNALLESCAVGTPVLTFPAPGGTSEIVQQGVNGYIAENEDDFIDKLEHMLRNYMSPDEIRRSVIEKYNEKKILADYENFFESLR